MDWVFDHIQLLLVIAGSVAYWLNQRRQVQAGEDAVPPKENTFDDPELAERTRRIREEIQRKIEQRGRGYTEPPPIVQTEPEAPPPIIREVFVARQPVRASSRTDAQRQAEILEQQAALMERLREAELMKSAGLKRKEFEAATTDHSEEARTATRSTVLDDLRSPDALRRAFILREVLGPPVALR